MNTINVILVLETFLAFVLAITIHECAHAGMATVLGDTIVESEGRLSFNPVRHMAPVGTLVAVVLSLTFPYAGLGWGRPVRFDALRLRIGPNIGTILIALAGPLANLVIGVAIGIGIGFIPNYGLVRLCTDTSPQSSSLFLYGQALERCLAHVQPAYLLRIEQFAITLAVTNILIALINIIPLHPLDGYKVLFALLPNQQAISFRRLEPYMEALLLALFFVLPYLAALLRLPVGTPASFFKGFAIGLFTTVSGHAIDFYYLL